MTYLYVLKNIYRLQDNPTMDDLYKHQNCALKPWYPHAFSLAMDGIADGLDREAPIEKAAEVINRVFDIWGKTPLVPPAKEKTIADSSELGNVKRVAGEIGCGAESACDHNHENWYHHIAQLAQYQCNILAGIGLGQAAINNFLRPPLTMNQYGQPMMPNFGGIGGHQLLAIGVGKPQKQFNDKRQVGGGVLPLQSRIKAFPPVSMTFYMFLQHFV